MQNNMHHFFQNEKYWRDIIGWIFACLLVDSWDY